MIEEHEVKTFEQHLLCDSCEIEMKKFDALASNPTTYGYKCSNCDNKTYTQEVYPKLVTKKVTE